MSICAHICTDRNPHERLILNKVIQHELILDEHLGFTDSICRCLQCDQLYLLELLDMLPGRRLFRVSMIDRKQGQRLLKNIANGSCDLNRADSEIHTLKTQTNFADRLLELDTGSQEIAALHRVTAQRIPSAHWRSLSCDGSWFSAL